ncbi:MAG: hypothetical protein QM811_05540 [Pirellulales bacterium]
MFTRLCAFVTLLTMTTMSVRAADATLKLTSRRLPADAKDDRPVVTHDEWPAARTALIICDVWDSHHSLNAVRRETEIVPRIQQVADTLRKQGVLIIHAPSDCMPQYAEHPARLRAKVALAGGRLPDRDRQVVLQNSGGRGRGLSDRSNRRR